jgi:sortase A
LNDSVTATVERTVPRASRSPRESLGLRLVRGTGWTFIWLGLLTLGFVAHQLWITTFFAEQNQEALGEERIEYYAEAEIQQVALAPDGSVLPEGVSSGAVGANGDGVRTAPLVLQVETPADKGISFALIRIPSIERLEEGWNVVEGVSVANLKNGAGHMPGTAVPGQPGNAVISGHRTTYGQPFHELDQLVPGDTIEVETALGTHVYELREAPFVVRPTDVWVTEPREGAWLTLTTCHPKFSARQRLIVVAELVSGPNFAVIEATS